MFEMLVTLCYLQILEIQNQQVISSRERRYLCNWLAKKLWLEWVWTFETQPIRDSRDTTHSRFTRHGGCLKTFVTGSAKTGLIAHDRKFNFLSQTQRHINTLSSFTAKMKKSWVVCFCWLLLPSPLAICTSGLGPSWSSGGKVEEWVWL